MGNDEHDFRQVARDAPGVHFASVTADLRNQLGRRGFDEDVGPRGAVYRKWLDSCFLQKYPLSRVTPRHFSEIQMLVTALDELVHGRMLEVADVLASRLRTLIFGIETENWPVAMQFLTYERDDHQLVSNRMVETAVEIHRRETKRAKALADARRSGSAGR